MIGYTLEEVAGAVGATLRAILAKPSTPAGAMTSTGHDAGRSVGEFITEVVIDSRQAGPGALFVPLPGEHVDGHDFIQAALDLGASAYLCAPQFATGHPRELVVDDPLAGLTRLGAHVRQRVNPTVVAITGSNGKTSTKDILAGIMGQFRSTVSTYRNHNNEIGIPLTLCSLEADTEVLIVEVGARGPGHIASIMPAIQPSIGILTSLSGAHLGEFGDMERLVQAKLELFDALPGDSLAIFASNGLAIDLECTRHAPGGVLSVGLGEHNMVRPSVRYTDEEGREVCVVHGVALTPPLPGAHQAANTLLALEAAHALGVPYAQAAATLATIEMSPGRMEALEVHALHITQDAYNANEASTVAGLETFMALPTDGQRFICLGQMFELGQEEAVAHERIGRLAASLATPGHPVITLGLGEGAALYQAGHPDLIPCADVQAMAAYVHAHAQAGDRVYIKGSNSTGIANVVRALHNLAPAAEPSPGQPAPPMAPHPGQPAAVLVHFPAAAHSDVPSTKDRA